MGIQWTREERVRIVSLLLGGETPDMILARYPGLTYGDVERIAAEAADKMMSDEFGSSTQGDERNSPGSTTPD